VLPFVAEESLGSVKVLWLRQEEVVEGVRNSALRLGQSDDNVLALLQRWKSEAETVTLSREP
jgi:hypothetical protein